MLRLAAKAAWMNACGRAGERGGGCADNPKCVWMRSITAGSSIAALIFN
jgi:hypothetical protein